MNKFKIFHFVTGSIQASLYEEYQTTRAAIADAVLLATAEPVKLYRVLEDDTEQLIYDSEKCKHMSIDQILEWARKGGKR